MEPIFLAVLVILFCSTLIRSTFGFGDALLAMPLLSLCFRMVIVTPLVALIAFTIAMAILIKKWREVQFASAWRLIVSSIAGIPVGLYLLKESFDSVMRLVLAFVIIGFSMYHLFKPKLFHLKSEKSAWLFGFLAGVLGGACNVNGPAVVIYGSLRRWSPETFRVTLQGYFLINGIFLLAGHATAGLWTGQVLTYFALSLPVVFLAVWIGGRLHHSIPKGKFDRYVHFLLIAAGVLLILQTVKIL